MRVIIAGSRDIKDYGLVIQAVEESNFEISCVLSGRARGADKLGELYASLNGLLMEPFPANWTRDGKAAGNRRNTVMADSADGLVAIWNGVSSGTLDMIRKAKDRKLKYCVFNTKTGGYDRG